MCFYLYDLHTGHKKESLKDYWICMKHISILSAKVPHGTFEMCPIIQMMLVYLSFKETFFFSVVGWIFGAHISMARSMQISTIRIVRFSANQKHMIIFFSFSSGRLMTTYKINVYNMFIIYVRKRKNWRGVVNSMFFQIRVHALRLSCR